MHKTSSTRYVSYKNLKEFTRGLKPIYRAASEDAGLAALDALEKKWGAKYPVSVRSWRNNWNDLSTLFRYSPLIRKLIHTTNAAENFHRQLRKVTKTKRAFVSEGALMKMLYLTTMRVSEKWTHPIPGWALILGNLMVYCRGQNATETLGLNPDSGLYTKYHALSLGVN